MVLLELSQENFNMYRVYVHKTWIDFQSYFDAMFHFKRYGWKITQITFLGEAIIKLKGKKHGTPHY